MGAKLMYLYVNPEAMRCSIIRIVTISCTITLASKVARTDLCINTLHVSMRPSACGDGRRRIADGVTFHMDQCNQIVICQRGTVALMCRSAAHSKRESH